MPTSKVASTTCFAVPAAISVHPHVFRSVLGRKAGVKEYQVRQAPRGADVLLCTEGAAEIESLARAIEFELASLACPKPLVTARGVEHIARVEVGKLKRFLPLEAWSE